MIPMDAIDIDNARKAAWPSRGPSSHLGAQAQKILSKGAEASEDGANFMLSVVKGIEPRDQIEAMLAAQWPPSIWPR
jgi:hypothetical protein